MAVLYGSLRITGWLAAGEYRGLTESSRLVGDGRRDAFLVSHTLGARNVHPTLYDDAGRIVCAALRTVSDSALLITFFTPPAAGETFTLVLRR
ncbi:MAG: hypothetical protein ACOX6D_06455 [Thermoguttaceae bacterium]|jgi:hypothetical protein